MVIRTTEDDVHCLPIKPTSRWTIMMMLFGSFVSALKEVEERDCPDKEDNLLCAEYVRGILKDLELEDVVDKLVHVVELGENL